MKVLYAGLPKNLGQHSIDVEEYFSYTYLPIKLRGETDILFEDRLKPFSGVIGRAACDFVGDFGLDRFVDSYVYLTAKHARQRFGNGFNRPGWHSDGFMSEDISYVWSNRQPTVFNPGPFELNQDDTMSMIEMAQQADLSKDFTLPDCSLVRMDEKVIHRVGEYLSGDRAFCKLVFSKDIFNLKGNSINYLLDYKWNYVPRRGIRNIPQAGCAAA